MSASEFPSIGMPYLELVGTNRGRRWVFARSSRRRASPNGLACPSGKRLRLCLRYGFRGIWARSVVQAPRTERLSHRRQTWTPTTLSAAGAPLLRPILWAPSKRACHSTLGRATTSLSTHCNSATQYEGRMAARSASCGSGAARARSRHAASTRVTSLAITRCGTLSGARRACPGSDQGSQLSAPYHIAPACPRARHGLRARLVRCARGRTDICQDMSGRILDLVLLTTADSSLPRLLCESGNHCL